MTGGGECTHPDLVAHGGWFVCRDCHQPIPRHRDAAAYIAAMRARLHPDDHPEVTDA